MEKGIKDIINILDSSLALGGYKIMSGGRDSLVIRDSDSDTDYEIKVDEIINQIGEFIIEFYIFIGAYKGIVKEDQRFMNKDLAIEAFEKYTGRKFEEFFEDNTIFKGTDFEGTNIYVGDIDKVAKYFDKIEE